MALPPEIVRTYLETRYPFYVAYQLDAATALLEKTVADFRTHVIGGSCDDFVHVALKNVAVEKREYYTEIVKIVWAKSS